MKTPSSSFFWLLSLLESALATEFAFGQVRLVIFAVFVHFHIPDGSA
jgi:hypothetical protein